MVGPSTPTCAKAPRACWTPAQADELLALIGGRSGVWDVLISGGDALLAPLPVLDALLGVLLGIDTVRNIRLASRLPVVLPQALIQGPLPALLGARAREARTRGTGISLHTQINHPDEISPETAEAARALRDLGFDAVRNQAVLLKGVNDTVETQADLHEQAWRLARVEPYCVYQCEIVPGVEHLRVGVEDALSVERALVGGIPGFCQPRFLVDLPGIGKRPLASRDLSFGPWGLHRWSVETEGTLRSAWHADPQRGLPPEGQAFWRLDPDAREALLVARLGETAP
jgi:lysine 2,3-aminomutase